MSFQKEYYDYLISLGNEFVGKSSELLDDPNIVSLFFDFLNKKLYEKIAADGSLVMLVDNFENTLSVRSWEGVVPPPYELPDYIIHEKSDVEEHFKEAQFSFSEDTIFSAVVKDAKPLLVANAHEDERFFDNGTEDFLKCGSYIFVPIIQKSNVVGIAVLSRNADSAAFTEDDFKFACDIVNTAVPSMGFLSRFLVYQERNHLVKDNSTASSVLRTLLPKELPSIKNVSVGVAQSFGSATWGDYYNIMPSSDTKYHFVVADVVGRGMNSLYVLLDLRAMFRISLNFVQDAAGLLSHMNKCLFMETVTDNHFASVSIISYDVEARTAEIATAGINSLFYFDSVSHTLSKLSKTSDPLGMVDNIKYSNLSVSCKPNDILLVCTDGLLECVGENGTQYGAGRLARVIGKYAHMTGAVIAEKVKQDVKRFCGSGASHDDQTLMAIKMQG